MLHIYRQITALDRCRPVVIAQKREQAERYPFEPVYVVAKPTTHFLRRFWFRKVRDAPWQISGGELHALLRVLAKTDARLLHIYFGHIAVHLLPLIQAWSKPSVVSFHGADVMVDLDKPAYRAATQQILEAVPREKFGFNTPGYLSTTFRFGRASGRTRARGNSSRPVG